MSIKYYQLAKDEELPEEFCAVRDVNGEPSEYTWYERMSEFDRELWVLFNQSVDWFAGSEYRKLQSENAKLRTLVDAWMGCGTRYHTMRGACPLFDPDAPDFCKAPQMARDLGIEVD